MTSPPRTCSFVEGYRSSLESHNRYLPDLPETLVTRILRTSPPAALICLYVSSPSQYADYMIMMMRMMNAEIINSTPNFPPPPSSSPRVPCRVTPPSRHQPAWRGEEADGWSALPAACARGHLIDRSFRRRETSNQASVGVLSMAWQFRLAHVCICVCIYVCVCSTILRVGDVHGGA